MLLAAGVPAPIAWGHVGDRAEAAPSSHDHGTVHDSVLASAAVAALRGDPVAEAIDRACADTASAAGAWRLLAAAWAIAAESGAPLAASLRELAAALRDDAQLRREVRAALAGPAASARLVSALPLVALVFGTTLGFDTLPVLLANPLGLGCLAIGAALLWVGRRWTASLGARAAVGRGGAGLELELLAIAMTGGASLERARDCSSARCATGGLAAGDDPGVDALLDLAARAGAPVAELLRAEAFRRRRVARTAGAERAAALGVRLMVPLGVCVLPAFVLLGVAPLMISVVSGTLGGAR